MSSGGPFVQQSGTICAISLEGILRIDSVIYFELGSVVQMSFKRFLIWSSFVQWIGTICAIVVEGIMGNIHVKLFQIWTSGSDVV